MEPSGTQLGMDVAFSIYAYHPFEELGGFFRQIPREVDGVITSGNRFGSAFWHMFPRDRRVVVPMGINDAEVHRLFWRLKQERPELDFQKIYVDFLDELHLSIQSFLTEDHGIPLSVSMDAGREQTPEEFQRGEYRQFQKLLAVWETGQFERIITRYSGEYRSPIRSPASTVSAVPAPRPGERSRCASSRTTRRPRSM